MSAKICIVIRSFGRLEEKYLRLPPITRQIALPTSRVLYTVIRSPHVHKSSREQFHMEIQKRFLIIETRAKELDKKYFWLKRMRLFGAQFEVQISCKTRLDKGKLESLLSS